MEYILTHKKLIMPALAAQVWNPSYLEDKMGGQGYQDLPEHLNETLSQNKRKKPHKGWELEIRWSVYLACGRP